jgi:hypothetical protein
MMVSELTDYKNDECLKGLWRQATRYHYASLQDKNPIVAMRHNGYAVGIIGVLKDISDEAEVKRLTGGSLKSLWLGATAFQDKTESEMFKIAKELKRRGIPIPF